MGCLCSTEPLSQKLEFEVVWEGANVSEANSISSDSRLLDSSNCIIASSFSRHSALRVNRNLSPTPDEQHMPESSEPRLDWSKLGEELTPVIVPPLPTASTPVRDSVVLAGSIGLDDAESNRRTIGSALPQTLLNLSLSGKKTKKNVHTGCQHQKTANSTTVPSTVFKTE